MISGLEVKVSGLEELQKTMRGIAFDIQKKAGRSALRKAAQVVVEQAKANARRLDNAETKNNIAANIVAEFSPREFRRTGDLKFRIGIAGGAKKYGNTKANVRARRVGKTYVTGGTIAKPGGGPGGDTYYWRFLEFGTKAHPTRPARTMRGKKVAAKRSVPAQGRKPLLRDAIKTQGSNALEVFRRNLEKAIMRHTKGSK